MIARLRGKILQKSADKVIIDISGVGYEVLIPFSTYYQLEEEGQEVSLSIYTYVREDALNLYGFRSEREKQIFLKLIQISGIGPRLAITILSGLPLDEFLEAVSVQDIKKLSTIPGVGKKTAQRIALEMKDKIEDLDFEVSSAPEGRKHRELQQDVVSALVNLGYPKNRAESIVEKLIRSEESDQFEPLLRSALKKLSS